MSISSPPNYGSPDWQRGYYSAQKVLATVPAGTASVTVTIPPNAESVIVTAADIPDGGVIFAEGTSTLYKYPGMRLPQQAHMTSATTWIFNTSAQLDAQVDIVFTAAPLQQWYVYADAGVHITADASKLTSSLGQQYVIPSVPSTVAGDHPLNELAYFGGAFNTGATVLASPGAGVRYRIFSAQLAPQVAGTFGALNPSSSGEGFLYSGASGGAIVTFPLTGLPLPSGNGVNYTRLGGSGFESASLTYTTETV